MASKADRIVVRLESEMRAKLHTKAGANGLDDAAYVRMLIYRELNELTQPAAQARGRSHLVATGTPRAPIAFGDTVQAETGGHYDLEEPEPLPVEEMDIPPDPDGGDPATLDDLLRAGPSLLDEMMAASRAPAGAQLLAAVSAPRAPQRTYRQPSRQAVPFGRPGSLTRPIGLNEDAVGFGGTTPNDVRKQNIRKSAALPGLFYGIK